MGKLKKENKSLWAKDVGIVEEHVTPNMLLLPVKRNILINDVPSS